MYGYCFQITGSSLAREVLLGPCFAVRLHQTSFWCTDAQGKIAMKVTIRRTRPRLSVHDSSLFHSLTLKCNDAAVSCAVLCCLFHSISVNTMMLKSQRRESQAGRASAAQLWARLWMACLQSTHAASTKETATHITLDAFGLINAHAAAEHDSPTLNIVLLFADVEEGIPVSENGADAAARGSDDRPQVTATAHSGAPLCY